MTLGDARNALTDTSDEDPAILPRSVLAHLSIDDIPDGAFFQVGTTKDRTTHLEWEGRFSRAGNRLAAEAEYLNTRKYWYAPVGLEQFMDLVRRAVETRHRMRGDVELLDYDDDGAYIRLTFSIFTDKPNLGQAFDAVERVSREVEEAAQQAADEVGKRVAEVAARLSGWGSETLDSLVEQVETAKSSDDRGRSLEELCSRLFAGVPGFAVSGRLRTATEEIDISIVNDSPEPRLRREAALILVECKNWSGKCGKDEYVVFREKLENRNRRCSIGFLVSWNGFTVTVSKELLRGSRETVLIVPIDGKEIRSAVRSGDFVDVLIAAWDAAVSL